METGKGFPSPTEIVEMDLQYLGRLVEGRVTKLQDAVESPQTLRKFWLSASINGCLTNLELDEYAADLKVDSELAWPWFVATAGLINKLHSSQFEVWRGVDDLVANLTDC